MHALDRPVWSALTSHQDRFGIGGIRARRFDVAISPFAAARDDEPESLAALGARTGNVWSLEQTAVSNGLESSARPPADGLVKIAVEVPYQPGTRAGAR